MDMCYDGALVMPSNYAVMDEEEMTYVEGGANISYNIFMRSRAYCTAFASGYRSGKGYTNISTYDLAAEIFAHAYAYYEWGGFVSLASSLGFSEVKSFKKSIMNGIDVKDGLDTAKICGIKRYTIFRAIFAAAPGYC